MKPGERLRAVPERPKKRGGGDVERTRRARRIEGFLHDGKTLFLKTAQGMREIGLGGPGLFLEQEDAPDTVRLQAVRRREIGREAHRAIVEVRVVELVQAAPIRVEQERGWSVGREREAPEGVRFSNERDQDRMHVDLRGFVEG